MGFLLLASICLLLGVELYRFFKVFFWQLEMNVREKELIAARKRHGQLARNIGKPEHPEITEEEVEHSLYAELAAKSASSEAWCRRPFWGVRPRHFLLAEACLKRRG